MLSNLIICYMIVLSFACEGNGVKMGRELDVVLFIQYW